MELKVWVEGIQRIVCGVTETTTCQDVVFALAHATGKSGRFTLSERWRNNERQLTPEEKPLKILMKWGEYSNDVQFILQWSESNKSQGSSKHKFLLPLSLSNTPSGSSSRTGSIERSKDKLEKQKSSMSPPFKSPTSPLSPLSPTSPPTLLPDSTSPNVTTSPPHISPLISPKITTPTATSAVQIPSANSSTNVGVVKGIPSQANPRQNTSPIRESPKHLSQEHRQQMQEHRNTLYRMEMQQEPPQIGLVQNHFYSPSQSSSSSPMLSSGSVHSQSSQQQQRVAPPYKDPPAPPPYRDPPRPNSCNLQAMQRQQQQYNRRSVHQDKMMNEDSKNKFQRIEEPVIYNTQYRELVNLVNFQREKLSSQQADLTKFDAEILFWESKEREKQFQLDFINQEMVTLSNANRVTNEQLQSLNHVEEDNEIVKQQEKTLKSELTLLRSKLANCETELLQCKNKIRLVMDEMQLEQRAQMRRSESRKQIERNLFAEMERLQRDVELAKQSTELHHLTADTLKKEVAALEVAITEKKRQVEQLVGEMKAANLQSLTVAGAAEEVGGIHQQMAPVDAMVGGGIHNRSGSTRKMIGSPRQLENAAPTSKNPHGVWV